MSSTMAVFSDGMCCGCVQAGDEPTPDCSATTWAGRRMGLLL